MSEIDECYTRYVRVSCLSGLVDLEKLTSTKGCKLSEETKKYMLYQTIKKIGPAAAQKLIGKLVEKGLINWDGVEDFEVEQIITHYEEDGKNIYQIKWKGWSFRYNTWEPEDNLCCPSIVEEYHKELQNGRLKRRAPDREDDSASKRQKVDEIFERLTRSNDVSPLTLLEAEADASQADRYVMKGLYTDRKGIRQVSTRRQYIAPNYANKRTKKYLSIKAEVQQALKAWQDHINTVSADPAPVIVENSVDLEGPPENFVYVNDYRPGEGIVIPQDPMVGCECEDCWESKKTCCPHHMGTEFAYYLRKRVRLPPRSAIYECNKRCKCGPECSNRVVQLGRKFRVAIFRTSNGKGWGVRALQKIKKGSFVMEYVGEVITTEEAERRGRVYDAEGLTYLFDLDFDETQNCPYTVDAGFYGNVSHFVNHSCDPNLAVYAVWINTLDPHLPRIALFSTRDINRGEELTFDYRMFAGNQPEENKASDELEKDDPSTIVENGRSTPVKCIPISPRREFIRSPTKDGLNESVLSADESPDHAKKFRIMCQCGSSKCRGYLF